MKQKRQIDQEGRLTFESDLWHGHYYVKEDQHLPGYLPNDEIWEIDATYEDQNLPAILLEKEVENQPTESHFTKTDIVTGEPVEGAKLQILDEEGTVVREWIDQNGLFKFCLIDAAVINGKFGGCAGVQCI